MENHVGYIPSTKVYYFNNWSEFDVLQMSKEDKENCIIFIGKMSKGLLDSMVDNSKIKLLK